MTLMREQIPLPDQYAEIYGVAVGRGANWTWPCHIHGGSDSLSVHRDGRWHCFACSARGGDMLDLHRQVHGLTLAQAARELGAWVDGDSKQPPAMKRTARAAEADTPPARQPVPEYVHALWAQRRPLAGNIGAEYLRARRCPMPPADGDLAFHPNLRHPTGYSGPALLARITDASTGKPMGLHRTWITPHSKADVKPARLTLGPKQGGVIRLWPDECVTDGLAIAEGIETTLSLAHAFKPAWSLIDAGNLAAFPVVPGISALVIGADHDPAGMQAATACADRWAAAGIDVRVIAPESERSDWNDAAAEVAA